MTKVSIVIVLVAGLISVAAAQTLEPATGGEAISSDTVGGDFTPLSGPIYSEGSSGDVGTGLIVLQLPPGFEWDISPPFPSATVVRLNPTFPGGRNINDLPDGGVIQASSVNAQQITFQITQTSTAQRRNQLQFANLRVRPQQVAPLASGNIVHQGTSQIAGVTAGATSWGVLNQVASQFAIVLSANGDATGPVTVQAGDPVLFEAVAVACPTASRWRDTWVIDGINEQQAQFGDSPCQRSPIQFTRTFNSSGSFEVEIVSERCTLPFLFFCLAWEELGRDSIEVIVVDSALLLEYRMEQASWTGAFGEVLDSSGFGRHGTAVGGADTDDTDPAIPGNPGTCRFGEFDGGNDGVDEPGAGSYLNGLTAITVMAWVYNEAPLAGNDRGIFFTNNPSSGRDNRLGMRYDAAGSFGGGSNVLKASVFTDDCNVNDECLQVETVSGVMVQNQWQHVAMTWEMGGTIRVFVDGSEVGISAIEGSGGNAPIAAVAALNIAQGAKGDRWQGKIDEFRIFDGALSGAEIRTWKDTTAPCEVILPDHIRLLHPGTGLTCQPSEIIVQACSDPGCDPPLFGEVVDVTLTSPGGNWSANPVTFSGQTTVDLQVTAPGTVTLDAVSDPPANSLTRCFVGETETCQMQWLDAGFVIDVPNHVSATEAVGTVAAVQTDDEGQSCAAAFADESRDVAFWSNDQDPAVTTLPVGVNGVAIGDGAPDDDVTLNFDANGIAPIQVRYDDVGLMQLNARFEGDAGLEEDLVLTGQDSFIVRPDHFLLTIPDNPGATGPGGPVLGAAGAPFEINVAARNARDAVTEKFGRESSPESVALDSAVFAPAGGNNVPITGTFGPFGEDCDGNATAFGNACGEFAWPEVGIVEITPRLASGAYLGSEDVVGRTSDPVGRFIPASFNLSAGAITDRVEIDGCTATFSYIGEPFGVDFTLDARTVGGVTTANYEGAFARLGAGGLGLAGDEDITVDAAMIDWNAGFGDVMATVRADRDQPDGPFEDFQVGTAPVDSDGVTLASFDIDLEGDDGINDHGLIDTTELRFGRLVVDNAVGSELGPLVLPVRAEYFINETWQVNDLDDCTVISLPDEVELTGSNGDTGDGTETVGVGGGSTSIQEADPAELADGRAGFTFSAPGSPGWVDLELLLGDRWPFLRDDLDDDNTFEENPGARASFGLFDGDDNRILLQEIAPR